MMCMQLTMARDDDDVDHGREMRMTTTIILMLMVLIDEYGVVQVMYVSLDIIYIIDIYI
jgi:hypothetical protein